MPLVHHHPHKIREDGALLLEFRELLGGVGSLLGAVACLLRVELEPGELARLGRAIERSASSRLYFEGGESGGVAGIASGDASLGVAASARETMAAKASRLSSESASRRRGADRSWAGMTGMTGMAVTSVMSFICMSVVATTAQASCGDWLAGHAMEASAAVPATVLPPSGAADERSAPPRRACRGPSCGRGPALPFAPTGAPVAPVVHERDAVLASAGAAVVPGRGIVIPADAPPLASALAERLERPPRRG